MKFQKIIIENIASIEKAEIDFENGPINENPIFLICGETGSGKSTILDAICLALFANTPRIDNSSRTTSKDNNGKEINFKDAKQLLRRGSKESLAELHFIGNNNREYIAQWKVRTKRGEAQNLDETRELKVVQTNETWVKKSEINEEIERAIGMKYEQFCKTSLLAQGEFTKFLSSDEKEKSEILEKLTGTEIYSKIGTAIFDKQKEINIALKREEEELTKISTLSEEELSVIKKAAEDCQRQLKTNSTQEKSVNTKKNWLEEENCKREEITKCQQNLDHWKKIVDDPLFVQQKNTVREWDETIEVRANLIQIQNKIEKEKQLAEEECCRKKEFQEIEAGWEWLGRHESTQKEELNRIHKLLEEDKENEEMYESSELIQTNLKNYQTTLAQAKSLEEEAEKKRSVVLPQWISKEGTIQAKEESLQKEESTLSQQIDQLEKSMKSMDLEKINQAIQRLGEALNFARELKEKTDEQTLIRQTQKESLNLITEIEKRLPDEEKKYLELVEKGKEQQNKLNSLKLAVSDAVKSLRNSLKEGDNCPICGKKIDFIVKDEEFNKAIQPFEEELNDLREKCLKSMKEYTESQSLLAQHKKRSAELIDKENFLEQAIQSLHTSLKEIDMEMKLGLEQENISDFIEKRISEYTIQQKDVINLQNQINNQRKEKEQISDHLQKIKEELNKIRNEITHCDGEIKHLFQMAENSKENAEKFKMTAKEKISIANWEENISIFLRNLHESTQRFKENRLSEEKLNKSLTDIQSERAIIQKEIKKITSIYTNWESHGEAKEIKQCAERASQLATQCTILETNKRINQTELAELRSKIDDFISKNKYDTEDLVQLQMISKERRDQMLQEIVQAESEKNRTEGALKNSEEQWKSHQEKRPEGIDDECTLEQLSMEIDQIEKNNKEIISRISEIQAQLKMDLENHQRGEEMRKKILTIRAELSKWDKLNYHLGSSDGKKFRLIAQSYVLRQLLHNANGYLKQLNDRYELSCSNNSLGILVQDLYMGGALRPCNTLSGGESFIVSLALALGLSSLSGRGLTTDIIFIDEGFGTLSAEYLDAVMNMLEKLHNLGGKKVGIISHVDVLKERIPAQIRVVKKGNNGKSEITICG